MLNLLTLWQRNPLLKLGVLGISLLCYAVMILHPVLAHSNLFLIPASSSISAIQSVHHAHAATQSTHQVHSGQSNANDCPICHQSASNPVSGISAHIPLYQRPIACLIKPFTVFLLSSQALANQDTRGPPAATV